MAGGVMAVPATYTYTKDANASALHEAISAASFGAAKFNGVVVDMSTTPDNLTVHTTDALTAGEQAELDGIIAAHNPATPSLEQQIAGASSVEVITADYVIDIPRNLTIYLDHTAPTVVTLPAVHFGEAYTLKDVSDMIVDGGGVVQNPVTLVAQGGNLIDGQASFVVDRNRMSVTLLSDSANFQII